MRSCFSCRGIRRHGRSGCIDDRKCLIVEVFDGMEGLDGLPTETALLLWGFGGRKCFCAKASEEMEGWEGSTTETTLFLSG